MTEQSLHPQTDVPAKATLFCPDCGHRDRYDGAWRVVESHGATRYRCPECAATVVSQPNDAVSALDPLGYWRRAWRAWEAGVRFWGGLPTHG